MRFIGKKKKAKTKKLMEEIGPAGMMEHMDGNLQKVGIILGQMFLKMGREKYLRASEIVTEELQPLLEKSGIDKEIALFIHLCASGGVAMAAGSAFAMKAAD